MRVQLQDHFLLFSVRRAPADAHSDIGSTGLGDYGTEAACQLVGWRGGRGRSGVRANL